jgi:prepilin-type N-terminal cleavage/methylation domain-containing protein
MTIKKGFTLIELMVVIAIITVLSGVLVAAINPTQLLAKGRDARRLSDVENIRNAIALAITDGEITLVSTSGCTTCTSLAGTQAVDGTGFVKFTIPSGKTGLSKFLPGLPLDPTNVDTSVYSYGSDGTDFEVNAVLNAADNAARMSTDGGDDPLVFEMGTKLTIL